MQEVSKSCETGVATNIIYGLALGYKSTVLPYLCIAVSIFISWGLAGMYGVAIASLGMLGTLVIALTIDAYGPVADNAGGIAEMVGLEKEVLPESVTERYMAGLRSYLDYVRPDGSVYHTCRGCRCPGRGRIIDYMARPPVLNDSHAFGPVTLAFGQALRLGITTI